MRIVHNHVSVLGAFLVLAFALLGWSSPAFAGQRVALVVGISAYRSVPSLPNPANDAHAVAQALRRANFQVTEITATAQLDRASLSEALLAFRRAAEGSEAALIYFAGHGVEVAGHNWLLPADVRAATPDEIEVTAIPSTALTNAVRGASKVRLVILDACRDNPFSKEPGWAGDGRSLASDRGLKRENDLPPSVVVLLATQPGTRASDGQGESNSPFARALTASIDTTGLRLASLPTMVSRKMRAQSGVQQFPDLQGIWEEPEWLFRTGEGGADTGTSEHPAALVAERNSLSPNVDSGETRRAQTNPYARWGLTAESLQHDSIKSIIAHVGGASRFQQIRNAADEGDFVAQLLVGRMYQYGAGVELDWSKALIYYQKAADLNNSTAMVDIGNLYRGGPRFEPNPNETLKWFRKADQLGNYDASIGLGMMYYFGRGVLQSYELAMMYYSDAAKHGSTFAMTQIGKMYEDGRGVKQDYAISLTWYRKAADLGFASAMLDIAAMYKVGRGVERDKNEENRWYTKVKNLADSGNRDAQIALDIYKEAGDQ